MTGIYLFATRDGERRPVEIEYLTEEEIRSKFAGKSAEDMLGRVVALARWIGDVGRRVENPEASND